MAYMGFALGTGGGAASSSGASICDRRHALRRIFAREPAALEDLLATVAAGRVRARLWTCTGAFVPVLCGRGVLPCAVCCSCAAGQLP